MPDHYPRPVIDVAQLFLAPTAEPVPELPDWWPNDKHLVLAWHAPATVLPPEDLEDWS